MDENYDVVVIGGGAAGLSGAIALARFRRSVLLVDSGQPRNAPADGVHNFLTRDGTPPAELCALGRAELRSYGATILDGKVNAVRRDGQLFAVDVDRRTVTARRVLVATGTRDELPGIPGLAQRWGRDVVHCPYCHGWEVRDRRIGVIATGPQATHQALLFRQLSDDVTLLAHIGPQLSDEERARLEAAGIPMITGEIAAVESDADRLIGIRLVDGTRVPFEVLAVGAPIHAQVDILHALDVKPVEVRMGAHIIATQVAADATGATNVPGLWVAGNAADAKAQVITAAASGLTAAAAINMDLILADATAPTTSDDRHRSSINRAVSHRR
jgi:thioredoxin reductase